MTNLTLRFFVRRVEEFQEKIDLLEITVYKTNAKTGETMFDIIKREMTDMKIILGTQQQDMVRQLNEIRVGTSEKVFDLKQKVAQVMSFKDQIMTNKTTIADIGKHTQEMVGSIRKELEVQKM